MGVKPEDIADENCKVATDDDFSGTTNGEFKYIGTTTRLVIPHVIKGVLVTSYANMFGGSNVMEVRSNNPNVTDMNFMFFECYNLTSLDISNFDTTNVTNMSGVFGACENLTSLDLSNFDTSNVTDMTYMFASCYSLTSLDVSNFDTSNVTNMYGMFGGCESLTSLDISNFDTTNVTNMNGMFLGCYSLTSLDLSSFDTSNVTDMKDMFSGCNSLTSLDVSNFDTSNVTNMYGMFRRCESLTSLDISNFDTTNVINMYGMFFECYSLTSLDLSNFDTSKVTDMSRMFYFCLSITTAYARTQEDADRFNSSADKPSNVNFVVRPDLVVHYATDADFSGTTDGEFKYIGTATRLVIPHVIKGVPVTSYAGMFSGSDVTEVRSNNPNITDMSGMFGECESLTSLNLSNFDTPNVTDMSGMFGECESLTSLDISNFDTTNVTNMNGMFAACSSLTSLDLSSFDTSEVTNMSFMFYGCRLLTSLDVSNFDTSKVTNMTYMFGSCYNLTSLDVSNFDTSNVTNMSQMFFECYNLISLDLSSFDTSNVTDMSYMFSYCDSVTSAYARTQADADKLNASSGKPAGLNFVVSPPVASPPLATDEDFSGTTDGAFRYIGTATRLTIPHVIKGVEATSYASMFEGSNVTEVRSNNPNVTDMNNMFRDCQGLTSLDLSSFDTSNVTNMNYMFMGCSDLTSLDLSNLDTSNVTSMVQMFYDCWSLTSLDISSFDTTNVTNMNSMFGGCDLTSLDLSNFDTSNVTDMSRMFDGCYSLTSLNVSNFDTSKVTNMRYMFNYCPLTSLDLSNFDTSNVTNMEDMFSDCNSLTSLDISTFDTSKVTTMNSMFGGCNSLTSLDLSNFDTTNVTNMGNMFMGCSGLTSLDLSSFDTSNVTNMTYMFQGCTSITIVCARTQEDADRFNTSSGKPSNVNFTAPPPLAIDDDGKIGELRSLLNGTKDEFNVTSGIKTQRVGNKTNVASGTVINYMDMATAGQFEAWGSGEHVVGVKGDTLTFAATSLNYQLAEPIETYYPKQELICYPNGTIYIEPVVAYQLEEYADGITVDDANVPIKEMDYCYKLDTDTGEYINVLDKVTVAVDGLSFTIADAVNGEFYEYGYWYDGVLSTLPITEYRTPLGLTLPVPLGEVSDVHHPTVLGTVHRLGA